MPRRPIGRTKPEAAPVPGGPPRPRLPTVEEIIEAQRLLKAMSEAESAAKASNDGEIVLGDGGFDGEHLMMAPGGGRIRPAGALAWAGYAPNAHPLDVPRSLEAHEAAYAAQEKVCTDCGQAAGNSCVACGAWHCDDCAGAALATPCKRCARPAVWKHGEAPKGGFRNPAMRNH
jgi:hypothetical protein